MKDLMKQDIIKQLLQREIKYHSEEMTKHHELSEQRQGSKNEKRKALKHYHKRFQTIKIARKLGLSFCSECGGLNEESRKE